MAATTNRQTTNIVLGKITDSSRRLILRLKVESYDKVRAVVAILDSYIYHVSKCQDNLK